MTIKIYIEHHVEHAHLLMRSKLSTFSWEHVILHAPILILVMPTSYS